ncbi:replication initiation protein RepC [uncultured Ruegeria sp.]|uniref:replication initiation protein RepC n=1 Tax=uncultured Ruegeria sp. TaxID=259304 RepID=UPI00260D1EAC|nr:replication initiation protein RepC [uncultured Ruegeria sp.]
MNAHLKAQFREPETYPVLPEGMQRSGVERLIRRIGKTIGMTDGQINVLELMIQETRPSDWIDPHTQPVCHTSQTNIAYLANLDERSIRRIERALEAKFGFVARNVGRNHQRGNFRMSNGSVARYGIVFSKLIEAVPHLVEVSNALDDERKDRLALKQKISAARRMAKEKLSALVIEHSSNSTLLGIAQQMETWPQRFSAATPTQMMQELHSEVVSVVEKLEEFESLITQETCRPDTRVRRYIQDTKEENFVSCNTSVDMRPAGKPAEPIHKDAPPNGGAICLENKHGASSEARKSESFDWLTPEIIYDLCSDEMKLQIMISQGDKPSPAPLDIINASIDRLAPLGIRRSAYDDAVAEMGDAKAALCILVIDRNRFHPETPIRSPGGVLVEMTRRHASGALRLNASLIALRARTSREPEDRYHER